MSNKKPIILGDMPKISISATDIAGRHTLASIDWQVEFYASRGSAVIEKKNATKVDENTYTVRVDTLKTGTGKLCGILYPAIPDYDVPGGVYRPPVPFDTGEEVVTPYYLSENGL
jgi:hypothetical protein